jgi:hypothetical protein
MALSYCSTIPSRLCYCLIFLETCGLCGLAAEVVLGVEVNGEKPQHSASFGLCKSVAEEVDVGVGGNRRAQEI